MTGMRWWLRRLVTQPLSSVSQLLSTSLRVSARRVERLMSKDLSQADKIVSGVGQELLRHRVSEKVRVQLDADDRRISVAKSANPSIGQRSTFTNKNSADVHWRTAVEIVLKCASGRQRRVVR